MIRSIELAAKSFFWKEKKWICSSMKKIKYSWKKKTNLKSNYLEFGNPSQE